MNNPNYNFLEVPNNLVSYITDKPKSAKSFFKYLLSRTQMMFKYTNLPETIDPVILERMLQVNGVACITDHEDKLYCFSGSMGGELDIYYRPTKFIVSNPHFAPDGFYKECIINGCEEHTGVLMYNDTEWQGLTALIAKYASLMVENVLTVRVADIMLRKMDIIIAGTDKAKKSADLFLRQLEDGKLASMADSAFLESIRTLPVSNYNGSYMIQFIELQQYLKGSFYNELGLRANYNMKREAIGEGESTLDADSVLPLCENMLSCRRKTIAEVNKLYHTNITVDYNSAWLENHIDSYLSIYNKIAESVANMHAQEQPNLVQFPGNNAVGQPTEGDTNGSNKVGEENGSGIAPSTSVQSDDAGVTKRDSIAESDGAGERTEVRDISENRPGEERAEGSSGVGRELEGTGQDEELIELEEVVEKMIDNVYDDVVNNPTDATDATDPTESTEDVGQPTKVGENRASGGDGSDGRVGESEGDRDDETKE